MVFIFSKVINDFDVVRTSSELSAPDLEVKTNNVNTGFIYMLQDDDTNAIHCLFTTTSKTINSNTPPTMINYLKLSDNSIFIEPNPNASANLSWVVYEYDLNTLNKIQTLEDFFSSKFSDTSRLQFIYIPMV